MAKKGVFSKGVVIGIIVLFIGIAVQPSIATIPIDDESDVDAKEYLFQTIIDIANNPDVKNIIKQNSHNRFIYDFDFKGLNSKLLAKNPRLLTRLLITKPSISHGYLDKIYDIGVKMVDILGEERVYEIMEPIIVSNIEVYEGIKNIVLNNEELSNQIDTLLDLIICIICIVLFVPIFLMVHIVDGFIRMLSIIGLEALAELIFTICLNTIFLLDLGIRLLIVFYCLYP